jgi:hypothetical protein
VHPIGSYRKERLTQGKCPLSVPCSLRMAGATTFGFVLSHARCRCPSSATIFLWRVSSLNSATLYGGPFFLLPGRGAYALG